MNDDIPATRRSATPGSALGIVGLHRAWRQVDRNARGITAFRETAGRLAETARRDGQRKTAELALMVEIMCAPIESGEEPVTDEFCNIVGNYLSALDRVQEERGAEVASDALSHGDVYLLADMAEPGMQELRRQLIHFGYQTTTLPDHQALRDEVARSSPQSVILDQDNLPDGISLDDLTGDLQVAAGNSPQTLIMSSRGDMGSRLRAARVGVQAYLVKPVSAHDLIDQLDKLAPARMPEPLNIMLVEDSRTQATYFGSLLEQADMRANIVSDPMNVLDALEEQATDLILMDMYMPQCDGNELARVIRQVPRYASIPIVFLSSETQVDRQLDAMSRGGDDFLTKPIEPAHLIRSVAIRAGRARQLRSLMVTDNLTGLLNHTRIKEELENEVGRTSRREGGLAFVMLDIDHFKNINDTHGHPAGDTVIRSLARVLQQRLRRTDSIGRYGGEEFAVIMPDATAEQAMRTLDGIRRSFASIRQEAGGKQFTVTFSAGIAAFPAYATAETLTMAADSALYKAKNGGRNQVVIT
ncbi:diguanylate cyclase [Aquisalimonas sp.]|uniref:GGDEF domain-containing protein n=1 Tax=unclassified Aquisalimonas TaxID=2644645 RepID=UPI0025C02509|nr:diguanylate cyclase [Aquisalimonas sp.]